MIGLMNGMAHGHANRPFGHPLMSKLDSDGSGGLSAAELEGTKLGEKIGDKFAAIDQDSNLELTKDEFRAFKAAKGELEPPPPPPPTEGGTGTTTTFTVTVVTAILQITTEEAAAGEEISDATPIETAGDDSGGTVSESNLDLVNEGEAALEILEAMTEPDEDETSLT